MKRVTISKYHAIGLMSGTSLDGVDVAYCQFEFRKNRWHFEIKAAQTFKYHPSWKQKLLEAPSLSGEKLIELHTAYGKYLGELCNRFIRTYALKKIDLIASHGHTVFHQPQNKFTFQLGDGNALRATTHLPVVFDFRSLDIALGGQGAPLVPLGDQLLFGQYDVCINLGGIANLSMQRQSKRIAFDICFCNMALNFLATKAGKTYDKNGKLSSLGALNEELLRSLSRSYAETRKARPSLAREGFEKRILPLLENDSIEVNNRLRTVSESIVSEIVNAVPGSAKKLLITGGGALNNFLIHLLKEKLPSTSSVVITNKTIINFKEALVFAFLGVLRLRGEINVVKSVTGASRDSSSGVLI